jgi:3-methyladenine DNA glycosylase AlkD
MTKKEEVATAAAALPAPTPPAALPVPVPATTSWPVPVDAATQGIVDDVVAWLRGLSDEGNRRGMARFGIPVAHAFGVSMEPLKAKARALGRDHALAAALWQAGYLETRMLAAFVDVPAAVTTGQIEAWLDDVDGWSLCDTLCIHLFGKGALAWPMARQLVQREALWPKRAGFALLATLAVHDDDEDALRDALGLVAVGAADERNFVKKAVSWALRGIGKRSLTLHGPALALAERLARQPTTSWVGRDAARELRSAAVRARLQAKATKAATTKKKAASSTKKKGARGSQA